MKKIKKYFNYDHIGHVGTLDPFAIGILLLAVGKTTKLSDYIHNNFSKSYLAIGKLGIDSDTGDITGKITQTDNSIFANKLKEIKPKDLELKLKEKFIGDYLQAPHKYSAAKFMGKKLYEYARDGIEVPRKKVLKKVLDLKVVKYHYPYLSILFQVSSGTYIRTLFSDCANFLGTIGTLLALKRIAIGPILDSNKLEDLPNLTKIAPETILHYPKIVLEERDAKLFSNGGTIYYEGLDNYYWVLNNETNLGLGKIKDNQLKVEVNFS